MNVATVSFEKRGLAASDFELSINGAARSKSRRSTRHIWSRRAMLVLLSLGIILGLVYVVIPRSQLMVKTFTASSEAATAPPPPGLVLDTPHASASVPAIKRDVSTATSKVLDCFQVAQPVLTPEGPTTERSPPMSSSQGGYTVTLMSHIFGNSYGAPFVGNYVPPNVTFNRVVINFTAVSEGVQFDRLALMYLNDTEVWRTSTAEPVQAPGIRWVYLKDMTQYLSLWKTPQKLIFDLENIQNDRYTGSFNTTLTATFFQVDEKIANRDGGSSPSDLIIPISARKSASNGVSQFTLPKDNAINTISDFPRNARRAVFSVSANGQAGEEFWWQNVLQSDVLTFNATVGELAGFGPFREVQVLIDGRLAGVQWPFPVVFTGGVVPSLHRPITGADVFDLREHEIDITPWLPLLCDGKPHTFAILVSGLDNDGKAAGTATLTGTVPSSWYVTGKIFVWLDDSGSLAPTIGSPPVVSDSGPKIAITQHVVQNATGANSTLQYTVSVARSFSVQGGISSGQGQDHAVSWSQSLSYTNQGVVTDFGADQINNFTLSGSDRASGSGSEGSSYSYSSDYKFPLYCNTTTSVSAQGNLTLWAYMDQGLELQVAGASVFPTGLEAFSGGPGGNGRFSGGSLLTTRSVGTAAFFQTGDGKSSSGFGTTNQVFHFGGLSSAGVIGATPDVALYTRNVTASNQTILFDRETIAGGKETTLAGINIAAGTNSPSLFAQVSQNGGRLGRVIKGLGGDNAVAIAGDPSSSKEREALFIN